MPFKARIYKVGINPCVEVPATVTAKMKPAKGYIRVTGKINGFDFRQTLCPIKDAPYRLYVNFIMLKGGQAKLGDIASFSLTQDFTEQKKMYPMAPALKKRTHNSSANKTIQCTKCCTSERHSEISQFCKNRSDDDKECK